MTILSAQPPHNVTVAFVVHELDGRHEYEARRQCARTLLALVEAGNDDFTSSEISTWAFRLAAYCCGLRQWFSLAIPSGREEHPDGWHSQYVLETFVEVHSVKLEPSEVKRVLEGLA